MGYNEGIVTFTANGALGAKVRVKITGSSATDPAQVEVAGAGEQHIGITEHAAADGSLVSVRMRNHTGTQEATAAGAFAVGATLYGAASGKVDDAASGTAIGIAKEAATADGDIVEIAEFTVISTTAATVSIADAGGFTAQANLETLTQEMLQAYFTAQAFIPVSLMTLMETDASNTVAYLGPATTPILDMTNGDTDSALRVSWAASNSDPVIFQTPLPPDLDVTADLVLHIRAAMAGATDTPTIASDTYFNEGDTKVEDVSAAITGATYAEYTITIAAADIPAGAQTVSVELTPGAHTTDALYITAMWLEYTRALLTS